MGFFNSECSFHSTHNFFITRLIKNIKFVKDKLHICHKNSISSSTKIFEMFTFASFVTIEIEDLRMLSTLLIMPSVSNKGKTIFIVCLASETSVRETSQSLIVNEVNVRHSLSPEFRTVSFMSSMARKAAVYIFFRYFPTYMRHRWNTKISNTTEFEGSAAGNLTISM